MTWDELREIAKATTEGDVYGLGWGLSSPTATFMSLAPGFGGTYFEGTGEDATLTVGEGEMALPELVHAMAYDDKSILPRHHDAVGVRGHRVVLRRHRPR